MYITDEQKNVIINVLKDIKKKQIIRIGGLAGVGKSTIINILSKKLKTFAVSAYTGKATNVLRQKGIKHSRTIHNAIYKPVMEFDETIWMKIEKHELGYDGFIIDEASMVSKEIHEDLLSYGKPIIYVGDHGQLEPIGSSFNLMQDPDYKLETIHRNAGEIAHFANHLRLGKNPAKFQAEKKVKIIEKNSINDKDFCKCDQTICAFNKTRTKINELVRENLNINEKIINIGEKIICLKNNRNLKLFNGMQGIVNKIYRNGRINFYCGEEIFTKILIDYNQFGKEKNEFDFHDHENPFDYAYAITAHKSQGDSFDKVIVLEESCDKWDNKRWNYTAASRAKKLLIWGKTRNYIPNYLI
jgi:exodeoxyribonuclease-5